jgi:hypothetical protein
MKMLPVALLLAIAMPASAEGSKETQAVVKQDGKSATAATAVASSANGAAGMRAYVDPESGQLTSTPSPEQQRALNEALERQQDLNYSSEGLTEEPLADGGYYMDLQGRFQVTMTAHVDAQGQRHVVCDEPLHKTMDPLMHDKAHAEAAIPVDAKGREIQ